MSAGLLLSLIFQHPCPLPNHLLFPHLLFALDGMRTKGENHRFENGSAKISADLIPILRILPPTTIYFIPPHPQQLSLIHHSTKSDLKTSVFVLQPPVNPSHLRSFDFLAMLEGHVSQPNDPSLRVIKDSKMAIRYIFHYTFLLSKPIDTTVISQQHLTTFKFPFFPPRPSCPLASILIQGLSGESQETQSSFKS